MISSVAKWDRRFLDMARLIGSWSKDPSTKVGAVIVDNNNVIVSLGYNGLPRGIDDTQARLNAREVKYKMVIHAERNALLFARRDLRDCTIYTWPMFPCAACASLIIQAKIQVVVAPTTSLELDARWGEDIVLTRELLLEAGREIREYTHDS